MKNRLRLAFDLDGTLTRHSDHLRFLADRVLMSGGEVHVITGRRPHERDLTLYELKNKLRFRFTELHVYPEEYDFELGGKISAELAQSIGEWKSDLCDDLGVDILFDDDLHRYNTDFNCHTVHI